MRNASVVFGLSIALAGSLMVGSGCRPPTQAAMVGEWKRVGKQEQIQFKADGTIEGTDEFGRAVRGRYEHLSATRLRMTLSVRSTNEGGAVAVDNSTGDCEVRVREDQLVLADPAGAEQTYERIR